MRYLYTVLCFPSALLVVGFVVQLFYRCGAAVAVFTIFLAALLAWFCAQKLLKQKRGLIMVVCSLIMSLILGVILLASLNSARSEAPMASIKQSVSNIRVSAELYFIDHNSYDGFCTDETVRELLNHANETAIETSRDSCLGPILKMVLPAYTIEIAYIYYSCEAAGQSYRAEAYLPPSEEFVCVDATQEVYINESSSAGSMTCEAQ